MRRSTLYAATCVWLGAWLLCLAVPAQPDKTPTWAGHWEGKLTVTAGMELRLGFSLTEKDGKWSGLMHSPDQGVKNIPLSSVEPSGDKIKLEFKAGNATYEAQRSSDGTTLKGEFKQGSLKLPLELRRVEKFSELKRPQTPKKPYPYKEEEVSYENAKHKIKLGGALTLPQGEGPFPCVLLITGSGAQDRDETLFEHKPFLVIADRLTRNGIAVLRVDDRGVGKSGQGTKDDTSADFMEDVLAGVAYLKTRKEINPRKIGLCGHSEGGLIAPMAAARNPEDIAFIILLAGPGLPGDQIIAMQSRLILKAMGAPDDFLDWHAALHKKLMAVLRAETEYKTVEEKVKVAILDALPLLTPEMRGYVMKSLPKTDKGKDQAEPKLEELLFKQMEPGLKPFASGWFRYFLQFDPRPTLAKVKCPVLAINGELDLQVPPKENLAAIEKALKAGGNKDVTVKEFPKLNHLFQTSKTGNVTEYATIEETMAPQVLECITAWLQERVK